MARRQYTRLLNGEPPGHHDPSQILVNVTKSPAERATQEIDHGRRGGYVFGAIISMMWNTLPTRFSRPISDVIQWAPHHLARMVAVQGAAQRLSSLYWKRLSQELTIVEVSIKAVLGKQT